MVLGLLVVKDTLSTAWPSTLMSKSPIFDTDWAVHVTIYFDLDKFTERRFASYHMVTFCRTVFSFHSSSIESEPDAHRAVSSAYKDTSKLSKIFSMSFT